MKNFLFILTVISLGAFVVCGQQSPAVKPIETKQTIIQTKTVPASTVVEREKFNPAANPNDDLNAAIARAQKENKRIVLDVGGEWCGWCHEMDNFLIRNAALGKLRDENFVWVKINFSEENKNETFLANYPKATGYPHLFVLDKDGKLLLSKDTSELEDGKKSYNLQKFTDFLNEYSPAKTAVADQTYTRRPEITIEQALDIAKNYISQHQIDVSDKYIDSIKLNPTPPGDRGKFWQVSWELNTLTKGGQVYLDIFMDKSVERRFPD